MIKYIEQAIKPHDKYQVEIKLDYQLLEGEKTRYQIYTYLFVPQNLGINEFTYTKADFYRDVQNYIRLKTPLLILREFTTHPASPLVIIQHLAAKEGWPGEPACKKRLVDTLKLLGAMLKSSTREHFNLIQKRIAEAPPDSKVNLMISNLVAEFLTESRKIADCYRAFFPAFNLPNVDEEIFAAYKFTDESISLLIEESAIEMFQIVEEHLKKGNTKTEFKQRLSELVAAETRYRRAHGYNSFLHEGDDNEEYIFRVSVLKKYAASVLYLSTDIRREGVGLEHLFYALAAGLSMVFATVVAFYFQYRFGMFTFPLFVALVVAYMFKDRMKDLAKSLFARYLERVLFDRQVVIRTLDEKHRLGVLREKVRFVPEADVPPAIMEARKRDPFTDLSNSGLGEKVICYTKDIVLYPETFKKIFEDTPEITGINDIMRYDIRAYLNKMDEPVVSRHYLEAEQLKSIHTHKVYHLNFVFQYKSVYPRHEEFHRRFRLVLNRAGIKRLEHLFI